jgi:peptidoglycan/LPS O-acetylase OafA/YrhL
MRIKWFSFIRIAGLLSVLTYHFFQNSYPGGFIGVDIFFTFSGFLITALMIDEFAKTRQFKLVKFYQRRFNRIVPPLLLAILVVLPFTYLVSPDYVTGIGKQIAAAMGFTTNYFEIATGGSYESKFIPHLFVHTWSLAVEVHFYILWGLIIAGLVQWMHKSNSNQKEMVVSFRSMIAFISLVFAAVSVILMGLRSFNLTDYSAVYFSSLTHCFPFFIGALTASFTGITMVPKRFQQTLNQARLMPTVISLVLAFVFLAMLGFVMHFDSQKTYLGGILIASLVTAFAIVKARTLHNLTPNMIEPKWETFIADISYSMYLYHWPLFVIFSQRMNTISAVIMTIVIGVPFSALSYYIIEPLLAGKQPRDIKKTTLLKPIKLGLAAGGLLLLIIAATVIKTAPGLTQLDQKLWISSLYQARDNMTTSKTVIQADVKQQQAAKDKHKQAVTIPKGVSIIGDSVTAGTREYLQQNVADSTVDAAGERTMQLAYDVMMRAQANHLLRENVVLSIGTNALPGSNEQLEKLINDLKPGHRLILVTPYDGRADATWNSFKLAQFERTLPKKYNFITIADWQKMAQKHPEVFAGTDGVHFAGRHEGDVIYAQTVNEGLKQGAKTPVKK